MTKRKLFVLLFCLLYEVSNAQNYALDFDGSNDHLTTTIDADRDAMPSTAWSGGLNQQVRLVGKLYLEWKMEVGIDF